MSESVTSILAKTPRQAYGFLFIFVVAEIVVNATPFPRTDMVGNVIGITFLIGAFALSSFLKLLPIKLKVINQWTWRASWLILLTLMALFFFSHAIEKFSIGLASSLFPYAFPSLLMIFGGTIICTTRTSRPDLMRKEEDEERETRQQETLRP